MSDSKSWMIAQMNAGRPDTDIAAGFQQKFGRPITVDTIRNFRQNEYVGIKRKTVDKNEAVEKIRGQLGDDAEVMEDVLSGLLMSLKDPDLTIRERVEVSREVRQNLLTKQQMAKMVDTNSGTVFVFVQNGQVVSHNAPEGTVLEDVVDVEALETTQTDND